MEELKIRSEKVDDVPLILHIISEMGIGPIIDEIIRPHGNREGLSVGTMIMIWLSYILTIIKGQPLGLRSLFIKREDHLIGLVRLLSLALSVLTLTEFLVRQALHNSNESLSGLYSGNPNRKTSSPSAQRLLKAFRGIFLSIVSLPGKTVFHLSPLSALQSQIISLLGLPVSIYHVLISDISFSFP
ncbi:MAG: hypothetical protein FD167_4780 [bacterium]|nr:MAG: hypothetical protein FD167_4780 [bacterium]